MPSFDGSAGAAVLGSQPSAQPSLQSPSCLNKKNQNPSLPPGDAWEWEGIRLLTAKIEASFALEKMTVRRAAGRGGWGGWGALTGPGHLEVGCSCADVPASCPFPFILASHWYCCWSVTSTVSASQGQFLIPQYCTVLWRDARKQDEFNVDDHWKNMSEIIEWSVQPRRARELCSVPMMAWAAYGQWKSNVQWRQAISSSRRPVNI